MARSLVLFLLSFSCFMNCTAQDISFMTYNIRLDVASDGENAWPERKEFLVAQLRFHSPDIFGTQEGLPHQIKYIKENVFDYDFIGQGRDGKDKGEYSAIFYNKKIFSVENENTFWLSTTPNIVSKGWDAAYPRICTYGMFTIRKTKEKFWVFNTHLDHKGKEARKKGIDLILDKIKELNKKKYPIVLMGDFNVEPESELVDNLKLQMNDTKIFSINSPFGPSGTFNGFEFHKPVIRRIDYIFLSKSSKLKVIKYAVLSDSKDLKYPSDHLPVYVELQYGNKRK